MFVMPWYGEKEEISMVGLCLICRCFAVCVCSAMVLVERRDLYGGFVSNMPLFCGMCL